MNKQLKLYHKVLPFFLIPVCFFVIIFYGYLGYATLTERPGYNGNLYYYYRLTRVQFYAYNFTLGIIAITLLIFQVKYFSNNNTRSLIKLFWMFVAFVLVIIICEAYLATRFVGKP
jgi:hypothetical protein